MRHHDRSLFLVLVGAMLAIAGVARAQQPFPTQLLTPTADDIRNTAPFSGFGDAVAIKGRTLMIGMPLYMPTLDGPPNTGRVGVFTLDQGGTWVRTGSIDVSPEDEPGDSLFGTAIALEDDRVAIGSFSAVRIYDRVGNDWKYVGKITSGLPDVAIQPAVAFQHDILAIGMREMSRNPDGSLHSFSRVYIYRIDRQGQARLLTRLPEKEVGGGLGGGLAGIANPDMQPEAQIQDED
jgi:hypothetical protein